MPEVLTDKTIFSLLEISTSIQKTIAHHFNNAFWIKAEMHKLNRHPPSGHCYPSIIEKRNGVVVAKLDATIWRSTHLAINQKFLELLHEPLKEGINILFLARVIFEPQHGLKLQIIDIDPGFSLGELEKEKHETLSRLKEKELFHKNKNRHLPLLPQRIAIISVSTSKGYNDFIKKIEGNIWNHKIFHMVFTATLQGDRAVQEIIAQLNIIKKVAHHFDAVAIIRGGGEEVGLSCYNNFDLCAEVADFPLPVLTGIGHSTNETVAETIAYKNAITPTDLADYILQFFHNFSNTASQAQNIIFEKALQILSQHKKDMMTTVRLTDLVTKSSLEKHTNYLNKAISTIKRESKFFCQQEQTVLQHQESALQKSMGCKISGDKQSLQQTSQALQNTVHTIILKERNNISWQLQAMKKDLKSLFIRQEPLLDGFIQSITIYSKTIFKNKKSRINNIEDKMKVLDPVNILKRGYSITQVNGQLLNSVQQVNIGDTIRTITIDGSIISTVQTKTQNHE